MSDVSMWDFLLAITGFVVFYGMWMWETRSTTKLKDRVDALEGALQLCSEENCDQRSEIQDLKDQRAGLEEDGEYDLEIELDLGDYEDGDD